ncbi:MAG TPA: HEPN domain-containing protein [Candidatus Deferrimicrobium sp.]|nr:HEPN domain-containing protein [Candidatus Deferrimicrobium sp.]
MTVGNYKKEISANLERAQQSINAAQELAANGFYDFAASRAYYAAFYAASAVLLSQDIELSKHSGVIANIHQKLVKTGKLTKEQGKALNWLFELRSIGDYGVTAHVSNEESEKAILAAQDFLDAIRSLLEEK